MGPFQKIRIVAFLGILLLFLPGWDAATRGGEAEPVLFNRDIRPIFSGTCFKCHGPDGGSRKARLRLDQPEGAFEERRRGTPIVPGDPSKSLVYQRITSDNPRKRMPPLDSNLTLSPEEKETIRRWIQEGARYQPHWALIPPRRPPLPEVRDREWGHNEIDRFILHRLEQEGLRPAGEADRLTLIRRISLDLTGLPPTPEEVRAFLADRSPEAYEKLVDRLLASPRYGEHRAHYWLDAARYGDTHGLHLDNYREMWPYRDWVIRAFNENMPFDRFVTEQLAGDLLEGTPDQMVATGFNRCNVSTSEGGSIEEEVYVRNNVDRVDTFGTVFLGMTVGCARCHDHKYDPITQKDYYSLFAFFNNLDGPALDGNKKDPPPVMKVPTEEQGRRMATLDREARALEARIDGPSPELDAAQAEWERREAEKLRAAGGKAAALAPEKGLAAHYEMDRAQGNSIAPSGGHGPAGRILGKAEWRPGKTGKALYLDGNTHVDLGDTAGFEADQAFSYGAWIRPEPGGAMAVVSRMDDANSFRGWDLYLGGGKVYAHLISRWEADAIRVNTERALPPGTWHHVFVTYDGSRKARGVKIYVGGKPEKLQVTHDRLRGSIRTPKPLHIGARNPGSRFKGLIDDVRIYNRLLQEPELAQIMGASGISAILATAPEKRTGDQKRELREYYRRAHSPEWKSLNDQLAALRKRRKEIEASVPTTLVFRERKNLRPSYILRRGEYDQKGEEVKRTTPAFLPPLGERPRNRLGLARWLLDPGHPLLTRVTVNRFWLQLFGTGLVQTAEDFGSQGEWPSHPELLDWLAVQFRESGWNVKKTIKRMVMSATYRQSSRPGAESFRRDPRNRLLSRGPRFRLDAEMLRDQALFVSGLLVERLGGPSVKPPQPPGLWHAVGYTSSNTANFVADAGNEKVHRRTLYTFIKRTAPPPQLSIFDASSRESCVVRRERTNTPLQALAMLNDPQYFEAARALAERGLREGGKTTPSRIAYLFTLAVARRPDAEEVDELEGLLRDSLTRYRGDPEAAKKLIAVGESKPDASLDACELAAWTLLANLILNLDEVIIKG